ncbi:MAG: hypothetical protein ACI4T6_05465, partial [Candidatus Flemingiibacterium sp.]
GDYRQQFAVEAVCQFIRMARRNAGGFGMPAHDPGDEKHAQSSFSDSAWQADSEELDFPFFKLLQSIDKRFQYLSARRIEFLFRLTIPFDIEQIIFEKVRSKKFAERLFNFKKFSCSGIVQTDIFGYAVVDFAVESKQPFGSELFVRPERDLAGVKHIISPCCIVIFRPLDTRYECFDFHKQRKKAPNTSFEKSGALRRSVAYSGKSSADFEQPISYLITSIAPLRSF